MTNESWQLVTEGLTTSCGEHGKGVPALKNCLHHRTLTSPEGRPSEVILERLFQTIQDAPDLVELSYRPLDLVSGEGRWIQLIRRLLHQLQPHPLPARQFTEGHSHGGATQGLQSIQNIT